MRIKKSIALFLSIILVVCLALCTLTACKKEKKGIVYVTALFSGGLYDSETGEVLWDPIKTDFDFMDYFVPETGGWDILGIVKLLAKEEGMANLFKLATSAISYEEGTLLWSLSLDQDGNSKNPNVIPTNDPVDKEGNPIETNAIYGVFGIYKQVYDKLVEKYGKKYDVQVFNYDWRYSPAKNGELLEKYLDEKGYDEVILISHSMGGPVVNQYLARSEKNRDRVEGYISCAPATLGSYMALCVLCNPMAYVGSMFDDLGSIGNIVRNGIDNIGDFVFNCTGLMTLLPAWQFINSDQYGEGEYGITLDGVPVTTKEQLYNFYKTRSWAYYLDENGEKIPDNSKYASPDGYKLKPGVANLDEYYDSFYIDGKFASSLVDTYYLVGTEIGGTVTGVNYDTINDTFTLLRKTGTSEYGDGTVPYYSSLGGQSVSDIPEGHLIKFAGQSHQPVGASWDIIGDTILKIIDKID